MQNGLFTAVTILILIGVAVNIYFSLRNKGEDPQASQNMVGELKTLREELTRLHSEQRREVESRLDRVNDQLYKGLADSQRSMQHQFESSTKIITEMTQNLASLNNTNKQVLDFSAQLQNLQDILKNPKQRGILGEYYLETLLKNALPPGSFEMQYHLGSDETGNELIPDAVVFVKEKIIPIDSKFSLENYNRLIDEHDETRRLVLEKQFTNDLKKRITETAKYIQPNKGTMDFAFMFIPHEAIYYDLLTNKIGSVDEENESLIQRAAGKYHVIIVSPTSFLAYLQTVLQALRALQIEETAHDIINRVADLGKHFAKYSDLHAKLGKNLGTVVGQFNDSSNELRKMSKDVVRVTSGNADDILEHDEVGKPLLED